MKAMVLEAVGSPLRQVDRPDPVALSGQLMLRVEACAVCRTDLHVCDGDLSEPKLPLIPRHEIVGVVEAVGEGVPTSRVGQRVGVPWLGHTCGCCSFCRSKEENLCDQPQFTGYTRHGGFATHVAADADYAFVLDQQADPVALAPLLCAGLIGWRSLKKAGDGSRIGLYGFGAAAHIIAQVCRWQRREVYAFSRPGDTAAQLFALDLDAVWAGGSDEGPSLRHIDGQLREGYESVE
ncbi:D-arabinose 1-dehydrogenase-like Zn-dependent alcohol dehydrogenase [Rhizobium sp. BK049]|nr:D-arabinose 1-dehydrogenase-like Zn-dependent alcohol dehydrogenase [Rhizobium sp. BK049]